MIVLEAGWDYRGSSDKADCAGAHSNRRCYILYWRENNSDFKLATSGRLHHDFDDFDFDSGFRDPESQAMALQTDEVIGPVV